MYTRTYGRNHVPVMTPKEPLHLLKRKSHPLDLLGIENIGCIIGLKYFYDNVYPLIELKHSSECTDSSGDCDCSTAAEMGITDCLAQFDKNSEPGICADFLKVATSTPFIASKLKSLCDEGRLIFKILLVVNNKACEDYSSYYNDFEWTLIKEDIEMPGQEAITVYHAESENVVTASKIIHISQTIGENLMPSLDLLSVSSRQTLYLDVIHTVQYLLRIEAKRVNFNLVRFLSTDSYDDAQQFKDKLRKALLKKRLETYDIIQGLANLPMTMEVLVQFAVIDYYNRYLVPEFENAEDLLHGMKRLFLLFPRNGTCGLEDINFVCQEKDRKHSFVLYKHKELGDVRINATAHKEMSTIVTNDKYHKKVRKTLSTLDSSDLCWQLANATSELLKDLCSESTNGLREGLFDPACIVVIKWDNTSSDCQEQILLNDIRKYL